jgi:hypothetical protein
MTATVPVSALSGRFENKAVSVNHRPDQNQDASAFAGRSLAKAPRRQLLSGRTFYTRPFKS